MDFKKTLKISLFFIVILFVIGYTLFEFRWIIQGPIVKILSPINGASYSNEVLEVKGETKNVFYLSLNGQSKTMDQGGNFKEDILLSPGYNIIELVVKDRFGRSEDMYLEVMYNI